METQDYGVQGGEVNGDVSQTMPMLGINYYFIGLYATYISSESETSGSETSCTSEEDMDDESTTSNRKNDSGNPNLQSLECMQHLTLMLNSSLMIQLLILSDYPTTASELWDTSSTSTSTSVKSSTSQYSGDPLPTYSHLLDYSPSSIDQPQPTDTIFVPNKCLWDIKLRCPPTVDITRDPKTEGYIRSFQDHLPPNLEDEDVTIINTPPIIIEGSDSDVICLD